MSRLSLLCAAVLMLAAALSQPVHAVDVRGVRLWAEPDNTRVVVDLSGRSPHSLSVLHNPERVVVDVPGGKLAKSARTSGGAGAVKGVRVTRGPTGTLRLVLDLSRPIQAKSFLSKPNAQYGYRLVVDLTGGGNLPVILALGPQFGFGWCEGRFFADFPK